MQERINRVFRDEFFRDIRGRKDILFKKSVFFEPSVDIKETGSMDLE